MEKIFKKSLALMVSAALCLTAFVGCLTVNAETAGSATVTVGEVAAKTTDTMVEVPVTIAVGEDATTGIAAAIFDITVDSTKFDFSKRYWDSCLTYDTKQNIHVSTITNGDYIQPVSGTDNTYRFLVEGLAEGSTDENTLGTFTSATFKLTFDVIDNTAGETAITFNTDTMVPQACNAGALDLEGNYTGAEEPFSVATVAGKINVQAAVAEPVLDENITATLGSGLADTVYMSFKISKASLASYSDFYLKVDRQIKDSNWNLVDADSFYINKSDLGGNYLLETTNDYWFYYRGVELYSLSVPINAVLYCKDADGNVVAHSNTFSSSLSALLKNLHATAKSKSNAKLATAITDILITGDKAVAYFTRNATDSDYAKLESPIANFDTSDATPELGELTAINVPYDGTGDATLTLGAGISTSPYVSAILSAIPTDSNINSYSVVFSCINEVTGKQLTSTTNGADMLPASSNTKFYSYLRTLPIYASNADITITVYKDGNQLGTAHYSLEQFISLKKSDATLGSLVTALGKMGQSFRSYKIK